MSETMLTASSVYCICFLFWKFDAKPAAATMSMMTYCTMVTLDEAQNESASGAVSVRLHCSMFTAYFWKGKMAE